MGRKRTDVMRTRLRAGHSAPVPEAPQSQHHGPGARQTDAQEAGQEGVATGEGQRAVGEVARHRGDEPGGFGEDRGVPTGRAAAAVAAAVAAATVATTTVATATAAAATATVATAGAATGVARGGVGALGRGPDAQHTDTDPAHAHLDVGIDPEEAA